MLFSDLLGFTAIMEKLAQTIAIAWLEDYLNSMANCVHAHGGVIIRFKRLLRPSFSSTPERPRLGIGRTCTSDG